MFVGIKVALAVGGAVVGGLWGVEGNGTVKEETRTVSGFTGVEVGYGIQATVTVGPKTSVKLEAEENLLPLIKTEVKDGHLVTRVEEKGIHATRPIKLTIVTPKLTSAGTSGAATLTAEATPGPKFNADASGGSALTVQGIRADQVEVDCSGASHVTLSGTAKKLKVDASGAAETRLDGLTAGAIQVDASGAAQVFGRATTAAEVESSGGAQVHIHGNPAKRTENQSGGSTISFEQ